MPATSRPATGRGLSPQCPPSLADTFHPNELLSKIHGAYGKAPCFQSFFPVLESIISSKEKNLFLYIYNSIVELC
ncbi:hypothetical protein EFS38_20795, partial [Dickeya undicola]